MTADPPKKRRWFQLSLTTLIVLILVAGVLVWANLVQKRTLKPPRTLVALSHVVVPKGIKYFEFGPMYIAWSGWPLPNKVSRKLYTSIGGNPTFVNAHGLTFSRLGMEFHDGNSVFGMIANILTGLVILLVTATIIEYFIRRRSHTKQQEPSP